MTFSLKQHINTSSSFGSQLGLRSIEFHLQLRVLELALIVVLLQTPNLLLVFLFLLDALGMLLMAAAFSGLVTTLVCARAVARLGGVTGDVLGAGVEVATTAFLIAVAVATS